jgi:ribonucleoside-diphosphate reductase alpha chain
MSSKIKTILKRDGRILPFDKEKLINAIYKAAESIGGKDRKRAEELAKLVQGKIEERLKGKTETNVEQVQDYIEFVLIDQGHAKTVKAFILYRQKRSEERERRQSILQGKIDENVKFSENALRILENRYLLKDENDHIIETPSEMLYRVASAVAHAERKYKRSVKKATDLFYEMLINLEFLPNSPTLMNAGTEVQQLSSCFAVPIEDSVESIFSALKNAVTIQKTGGGTGFAFSRLRPKDSQVGNRLNVSAGPISFLKVFNSAMNAVKQSGRRQGANMGVLRVDHPDILEFIKLKQKDTTISNFNISVAITNSFMDALKKRRDYELIDPNTKKAVSKISAAQVFDNIVDSAWKNGDPGLIFIDRMNERSPVKHIGEIETTSACAEQPLLPNESCNLGSINLTTCLMEDKFDWEKLKSIIHKAVHFLDNVVDVNQHPIKEIEAMTKKTRKIGLGIMGFADVLYKLRIPYNSNEGLKFAEKLMKFIRIQARKRSEILANKRGPYPAWENSKHQKKGVKLRNATILTMAQTGSTSMIADVSPGMEPNFAISYIKTALDGKEFIHGNTFFKEATKEKDIYSLDLMRKVALAGSLQDVEGLPREIKKIFVTTLDIEPEWHVKMQATFQKYVDSSVSKTVNLPQSATLNDVRKILLMAWNENCNSIALYRQSSVSDQVLKRQT